VDRDAGHRIRSEKAVVQADVEPNGLLLVQVLAVGDHNGADRHPWTHVDLEPRLDIGPVSVTERANVFVDAVERMR
jgi:hypothetical protein